MIYPKLKIGLDIDDTIADWRQAYLKRFKAWSENEWSITRNVENILINERTFWLNIPVLRRPNFKPALYCSARVNKKCWTKTYLRNNHLPDAPLFQINGYKASKTKILKGRVDVFIEDSIKNFIDLNSHGIPCLLIDSEHNQSWGPVGRIFSLEYDEIKEVYALFKDTIFPHFKESWNSL